MSAVRLQKFLAEAGVASRRACEQIILAGRVQVNGTSVRELGTKVDPSHDRVVVDGQALKAKRKLYLALNKPRGYICTRQDPEQRRTLAELLPAEWSHVYSVGRLDFQSEGLILLTNDGEFSLRLTHPRYGVKKKYLASIEGEVTREMISKMTHGIDDEGETLKADRVRLLSRHFSRCLVELELSEGKNREVRRLFETQGLLVNRLQRTQIGPVKLGELPVGKWRTLTEPEIKSLLSAS
ncbi:MAG: rRNA pseudouridine synthase [Verrucomicrobia bacterium]|nr:rRNA pseudouridine synthase [Verrucomicrobiota bacterium]